MSQRDKLIAKMRGSPQAVSFDEVKALADHFGFASRQESSHVAFSHPAHPGPVIVVKPHGGSSKLRPTYVRNFVEALERAGLIPDED